MMTHYVFPMILILIVATCAYILQYHDDKPRLRDIAIPVGCFLFIFLLATPIKFFNLNGPSGLINNALTVALCAVICWLIFKVKKKTAR